MRAGRDRAVPAVEDLITLPSDQFALVLAQQLAKRLVGLENPVAGVVNGNAIRHGIEGCRPLLGGCRQGLLRPLALRLSVQTLQAERDGGGGLFKQGNLLVLKDIRFGVVDRDGAPHFTVQADGQSRCGQKPVRHRGRAPRRCSRISDKVIDDARPSRAEARSRRAVTFGTVVGVDFDCVEIVLAASGSRDGDDGVSRGIWPADPDHLEACLLGRDPADFAEQFLARLDRRRLDSTRSRPRKAG